jgi:hypothetical protein
MTEKQHQTLKGYIWWDGYHVTREKFAEALLGSKKEREEEKPNPSK